MNRTDRSPFASWWWTVDHTLIVAAVVLLVSGLVFSPAASPAVAERIHAADSFKFVKQHAFFFALTLPLMFGMSFMGPRLIRQAALVVFVGSLIALVAVLLFGQEIKGSRRWINVLGFGLQPSEFVKPAFIILTAWLFSANEKAKGMPGMIMAFGSLGLVIGLLVAQPDIGQTILTTTAWLAIFFVAGMSLMWIIALGGASAAGILAAYTFVPYIHARVNRFLVGQGPKKVGQPENALDYQARQAHDSFLNGGWFGRGPGEGTVKRLLPDSHTDYIFAVIGEEYGLVTCAVIVMIFALIVFRGLSHAMREDDSFIRYAVVGLVTLIGVQSSINIAVSLQMMPAKGMTLPFISYGGSSLVAMGFEMGCLLALTRRRPQSTRIAPPISFDRTTNDPAEPA